MKCANCGNDVPDTAKVCGYCGKGLKAIDAFTTASPSPSRSKSLPGWAWVVLAGLGTLIVSAILFLIFWEPSASVVITESPTRPAAQIAPTTCEDKLAFVSDVTIPDGTIFEPGTPFLKTWRIKNTGTCTWRTSYKLVFKDGPQMDAPQTTPLTESVPPQQEFDISINFTSPATPGSYKSFWHLQNTGGVVVPVEGVEDNSIFVDITVQTKGTNQTENSSLQNIVPNSEVTYQNGFDKDPSWETWGTVIISDGKIIIKGIEGTNNGFRADQSIKNIDQAILVKFQLKERTVCNLKIVSGKWGAESWRGVGIQFDSNKRDPMTDVEYGKTPEYLGGKPFSGDLEISPNKWYYIVIGISGEGEFDARLWDALNSASNKAVTWQLGKDWQDVEWKFEPWCGKGEMGIDDYQELNLDIRNLQLP